MSETKIDAPWHRAQVQKYREVQPEFQMYAEVLENILKKAGELYAPLCIVGARAKSISSFAEKAVRKAFKYKDPVNQITDLCGARVITHFQHQAERICRFIRDSFDIDEANSLDVRSLLRVSEFGYRSVHYVVTPKTDQVLGVTIPKVILGKKAEIQVRTFLQHAWADISHDRMYKTSISVPERLQRDVYRMAAMMETADDAFTQMAETIDYYSQNYGAMLSEAELEKEIGFIQTILANETDRSKKPEHALRLAKLLKTGGCWGKVIDLLKPYVADTERRNDEIPVLLGHALCRHHKAKPSGREFRTGQTYLKKIAQPGLNIDTDKPYSAFAIFDPKAVKLRAEALYWLACSLGRIHARKADAKNLFDMAHRLEPANPYYFAAYVEYEIYCSKTDDLLRVLRPAILETIRSCREHVHMGIEQTRAYFTMGRLLLILEETDRSLGLYAKVVDLCVTKKACIPREAFDDELDALVRLNSGNKTLPDKFECIRDLLLLAKWVKFGDASAKRKLNFKALRRKPFNSPVILIAGGADDMPKAKMPEYEHDLTRSLQSFEGTVIAGGTSSGIPGLVGLATQAARRNKNGKFRLIGYLPQRLPSNTKTDKYYDELIRTKGKAFSARELIQYWIDLVLEKVRPSDVLMLGINGGRIADLEYRLALALGARVGLVESSGRAATGLLLDEDWAGHERILIVPHEAQSAWAFVNQLIPSQLTGEQIEEAAKRVHGHYLKKKIEDKNTSDPSMLPWEKLDEGLQESNRQQVAFMEHMLKYVGYGIRKVVTPVPVQLDDEAIIRLAEMEHARWNIERLNAGWKYGPKKDVEKKSSPYLVCWNALPDHVKEWDINAVKQFPIILAAAGYEIYPLKPIR